MRVVRSWAFAAVLAAVAPGCSGPTAGNTQPPIVNAGADVTTYRGRSVTLMGFGYDADNGLTSLDWTQVSGPAVVLTTPNLGSTSFTAPAVVATLEFRLTAWDGFFYASDNVVVQVQNRPPAVGTVSLSPSSPRTLDDLTASATASDPDLDTLTLTYAWEKNGTLVAGQSGAVFPNALTTKGDVITAVVSASDGLESASSEASVTILDTPPTVSATPPTQATHCASVAFAVTASDVDGDDPGPFAVTHGPAGMAVSTGGNVTWSACVPMFERALSVHWGVQLSQYPQVGVSGSISVTDSSRVYPLRRTGVEIPVYPSGLHVGDLDGNGTEEMLIASSTVLYELAKSGSVYAQAWVYPYPLSDGEMFSAVTARDVDLDGRQEIFIASEGRLARLDGVERRLAVEVVTGPAFTCRDLEVADLSGDGSFELVCMGLPDSYSGSNDRVVVYDASTLAVEWQTATGPLGVSLALGNVDADPALEIVTARGYVYDGATQANQWAYGPGFGNLVDNGDVDGDGDQEIIGLDSYAVTAFDAVAKSPLWQFSKSNNGALLVVDFEDDAKAEIIVGDGQWGNVTAYRFVTGTTPLSVIFQVSAQDYGVSALGVGDVDGDTKKEFVWGSGSGSSGEDSFVVAGRNPNIGVEWTNTNPNELDGPFLGGYLVRTTSTARRLVFGTVETDNGYGGSRFVAMDPATGLLTVSSAVGDIFNSALTLNAADYDNDGIDEVLYSKGGAFAAYNLATSTAEWTSSTGLGQGVAVVHGDANADGYPDLLSLTSDGFVYVYDVRNQVQLWKSTDLGDGVDLDYLDVDGDGVRDLVVLTTNYLFVYGRAAGPGFSYLQQASASVSYAVDLAAGDLDVDGAVEIYALQAPWSGAPTVKRFDEALATSTSYTVPATASTLHVEALGSGRRNLLVGVGTTPFSNPVPVKLRAVDPATGVLVWESPALSGIVSKNSVQYADVGGSTVPEIAYGTNRCMNVTR